MPKLIAIKYKHAQPTSIMIDWYIGKKCNFSCSYCADFIHDNYSAHVPFSKMKIFVDKIVERYGSQIHWSLTGGEPTLNPEFLDLLSYLQDKKYHISVCTNGSRNLNYLLTMFEHIDNLTFSLHFEHISNRLDEYLEKIIELENWRNTWNKNKNRGWNLNQLPPKQMIVRLMVLPGYNKEIEELTEKFKSAGIEKIEHRVIRPQDKFFVEENKIKTENGSYKWKIKSSKTDISSLTKVAPDKTNHATFDTIIEREERWYSEEDKKTLEKLYKKVDPERKWIEGYIENDNGSITVEEYHYNSLNYEYKTNFKGWKCYAGISLLKIAPNGDIFIANCFQGGAIGNIYNMDESFNPPIEPVTCTKERCTDPMDLRQVKYVDEKYKRLVIQND